MSYASGLHTNEGRVNYASGQAISNQSNIAALNTASGIATSLLAVSGTATFGCYWYCYICFWSYLAGRD